MILLVVCGGCSSRQSQVLGSAPSSEPSPISAARTVSAGSDLVIAGEMVEKCPVAGCWFDVRDGSGTIRVDTKNAGFAVLEVPLHSRVVVTGRVRSAGGEPQLEAAGVRY